MEDQTEIILPGVRGDENVVVRVGQTIRKVVGPNTPFVERLLCFLSAQQFRGAPEFLGYDHKGRMILSYITGEVPHEDEVVFDDGQLAAAAHLIREFHDLTANSELAGEAEVVCHTDLGPHNMVFREGVVRAIIDWDDARPGTRLEDLAHAVWSFTDVGCDDTPVAVHAHRIRVICDAYGCEDYSGVVAAIEARLVRAVNNHREANRTRAAEIFSEWVEWFRAHGPRLRHALTK